MARKPFNFGVARKRQLTDVYPALFPVLAGRRPKKLPPGLQVVSTLIPLATIACHSTSDFYTTVSKYRLHATRNRLVAVTGVRTRVEECSLLSGVLARESGRWRLADPASSQWRGTRLSGLRCHSNYPASRPGETHTHLLFQQSRWRQSSRPHPGSSLDGVVVHIPGRDAPAPTRRPPRIQSPPIRRSALPSHS